MFSMQLCRVSRSTLRLVWIYLHRRFVIVFALRVLMYVFLSLLYNMTLEQPLSSKELQEIALPDVVPRKILVKVNEFWVCLNDKCRKIFWQGPKYKTAKKAFEKIIFDVPTDASMDGDDLDDQDDFSFRVTKCQ